MSLGQNYLKCQVKRVVLLSKDDGCNSDLVFLDRSTSFATALDTWCIRVRFHFLVMKTGDGTLIQETYGVHRSQFIGRKMSRHL